MIAKSGANNVTTNSLFFKDTLGYKKLSFAGLAFEHNAYIGIKIKNSTIK